MCSSFVYFCIFYYYFYISIFILFLSLYICMYVLELQYIELYVCINIIVMNVSRCRNNMEESTSNGKRTFAKNKKTGTKKNSLKQKAFQFSNVKYCTFDDSTRMCRNCSHDINNKSSMLTGNEAINTRRILGRKIDNDTNTVINKNYAKNHGRIIMGNSTLITSNASSPKVQTTSVASPNYVLENKTSELLILGNVKKRLEEDYDDYFSLSNIELQNDLFDHTVHSSNVTKINQPAAEINVENCRATSKVKRARSMLTSTSEAKHYEIKEQAQQSIPISLTCASSVQITRSDLSQPQSSYHTSLRGKDCSSSSSNEYCTASNLSLTNLQSSDKNSLNMLFQNRSLDTDVTYDSRLKYPQKENSYSNGTSYEDVEVSQDAKEYLDQRQLNRYTLCCYQRNSLTKFSNSSKLITESLDSGILTHCSHDHFRTISDEQFRQKNRKRYGGQKKCYVREVDLLPTYDFNTDSSYSDESLNRRVDVAVKKFTENLILSERRARRKLRGVENQAIYMRDTRRRKKCRQVRLNIINIRCRLLGSRNESIWSFQKCFRTLLCITYFNF